MREIFKGEKINFLLLYIIGALIGKISIFNGLNPILIAFVGYFLFNKKCFLGIIISVFLGALFSNNLIKYGICILLFMVANFIFKRHKIIICIIISIISDVITNISIELTIFEMILVPLIFFVLQKGIRYILNYQKRQLTNDEIVSIGFIISISIYSSYGIIGKYTLFIILCISIFTTYKYSIKISSLFIIFSASLASLFGVISSDLIIIICLSSIFSSLACKYGKFYVSTLFTISLFTICIIVNSNLLDIHLISSSILANILFIIVPFEPNIYENIEQIGATQIEKIQILATNRLNIYASSFDKLSKTFYDLSDKKEKIEQKDLSSIIDDVATRVCSRCSMKKFCWEDDFYTTYQTILNLINKYENSNIIKKQDVINSNEKFYSSCVRLDEIINILNNTLEIYKINMNWKNKIIEGRELVGKQLTSVSKIINDLSSILVDNIDFKVSLELKLKKVLQNNNIYTKNIIITENEKSRLNVILKVMPCYVPNKCSKSIIPIVNEVLGKNMCRNVYECIVTKEDDESICTLNLVEEQNFRISTYVITERKHTSKECGDSHTSLKLSNGNHLLALSDGMGSGHNAKKESLATIELLEEFMEAGFSKNIAINMINSVLFLKSSKESFATLDMCSIDLYNGFCEFIKIGAVSTFITRENKVDVIKSTSLPVGVLDDVCPEFKRKRLKNGDIIVMVTDGAIDSSPNIENREDFIIDILKNNKSKNTEEIAQKIYDNVSKNYHNKLKDDVTILVARIWK